MRRIRTKNSDQHSHRFLKAFFFFYRFDLFMLSPSAINKEKREREKITSIGSQHEPWLTGALLRASARIKGRT